jgi:hypothetical protein
VPISFARGIVMVSPKMCSGQPLQGKTHIYIYIWQVESQIVIVQSPLMCPWNISKSCIDE